MTKTKQVKRFYVFYYEHEHLWGDPKKRRVRVGKRPKEYQGPFDTKTEASQAISRDAKKYKAKVSDYQIAHLTPAQFSRKWHGEGTAALRSHVAESRPSDARPGPGRKPEKSPARPRPKRSWLLHRLFGI